MFVTTTELVVASAKNNAITGYHLVFNFLTSNLVRTPLLYKSVRGSKKTEK